MSSLTRPLFGRCVSGGCHTGAVLAHVFGLESEWPQHDLIGYSEEFDLGLTLAAYDSGVFPMPIEDGVPGAAMHWWSPCQRGILELDALRVSRSLRKTAARYTTSVDRDCAEVLRRCADPNRDGGWIDQTIAGVFLDLHEAGVVHSIEVWDAEQRLVGGLYGVSRGGLFAGESMFHDPDLGRDASKVALIRLVEELTAGVPEDAWRTDRLLDVQWRTEHLATLGATEVPRTSYLERLGRALEADPPSWPEAEASTRPVRLAHHGSTKPEGERNA